jgi:hypothetical protein
MTKQSILYVAIRMENNSSEIIIYNIGGKHLKIRQEWQNASSYDTKKMWQSHRTPARFEPGFSIAVTLHQTDMALSSIALEASGAG